MLDKPYIVKEGNCFYCGESTNQYYDEDNQFICDKCLFLLEEEIEEERQTEIYLSNSEPKGSTHDKG